MNTERTHMHGVTIRVESYSDGVYNLVVRKDNLKEERITVNETEANRICKVLGEELPKAEPEPPESWG